MVHQMLVGLRQSGALVMEFDTDLHRDVLDTEGREYDRGTFGPVWLRPGALDQIIGETDPQLVVCNAGGLSFRPGEARRLRERRCLLGIALSDPDVFAPATRHIAPHFDVFLTNAPACVERYVALGARAAVLPVATNEEYFRPVPPRPEMVCDALVVGRAHDDRIEPVRRLTESCECHVYGEGWDRFGVASRGLIFGEDLLAALSSARATIIFFRTPAGHPLVKVGLFDFAAAGALVVTNRFAEVEPYFEYGREILGFETTAELLETVAFCRRCPEEATRIRAAGRRRVLAQHVWRAVWPRLLGSHPLVATESTGRRWRGGFSALRSWWRERAP